MSGRIVGISGTTVLAEISGTGLYELVLVGDARMAGEVIKIEGGRAFVQVFEDTRGLGIGEEVIGTGNPLTVTLGPGLLGNIYDGLQRPLERLRAESGPFIRNVSGLAPLDVERKWEYRSAKSTGERVKNGEVLGYFEEGEFAHPVTFHGQDGEIERAAEGRVTVEAVLAELKDGRKILGNTRWSVRKARPYRRKLTLGEPLVTGQRIIDFLYPVARGGTAIMPGGFGTGKTILEQSIAKFADVDIVIYVGCGERGNEMTDLIEEFGALKDRRTEKKLMQRTILVANTSNMPVAARESSIYTGVAMGEYYRDMGYHVLLLADSLSRWAEALREISSSLGEMPGEEAYPAYLASQISAFFERAGAVETLSGEKGSLTMICSVSPPGGDFTEPVTQACFRVAGGSLMLDTSLAHQRHFPAINWSQSYSLYRRDLREYFTERYSEHWEDLYGRVQEILRQEARLQEITEIVGYEGLRDADRLVMETAKRLRIEFLQQNAYSDDAFCPPEKTLSMLEGIMEFHDSASRKLEQGRGLEEILAEARKDGAGEEGEKRNGEEGE